MGEYLCFEPNKEPLDLYYDFESYLDEIKQRVDSFKITELLTFKGLRVKVTYVFSFEINRGQLFQLIESLENLFLTKYKIENINVTYSNLTICKVDFYFIEKE